jgi:hypothetical protein
MKLLPMNSSALKHENSATEQDGEDLEETDLIST